MHTNKHSKRMVRRIGTAHLNKSTGRFETSKMFLMSVDTRSYCSLVGVHKMGKQRKIIKNKAIWDNKYRNFTIKKKVEVKVLKLTKFTHSREATEFFTFLTKLMVPDLKQY